MAKKKGEPAEVPPTSTISRTEAGNGEKRLPTFKVGPIPTDASSCITCSVWESEAKTGDGRTFKVHTVTIEALSRDADGQWKPVKGFRGSQLYALLYCVQRASDFILCQRDPANDCPF